VNYISCEGAVIPIKNITPVRRNVLLFLGLLYHRSLISFTIEYLDLK